MSIQADRAAARELLVHNGSEQRPAGGLPDRAADSRKVSLMSAATGTDSKTLLEIGTVIAGKWVILEFIGKGAMGEVYRAHQINLQRDVAIKVVSRELLKSFDEDEQEIEASLQRFRREVQAMAQVRHSNVVQVYDHGTVKLRNEGDEAPVEFIAMEYIPGHSLRYTMSEEGFYPEEDLLRQWLTRYFLPVLNGVEAVHLLDVIHRDLKPENILLDADSPKIADFGLARSNRLRPVTQSMDMKGTLHYMSPEHFFDFRKADQRADIYSLGKILFEAVDGKFADKSTPFRQVSLEEAETPFFGDINRIIEEATAEKLADRTDSVALMRRGIEDALAQPEFESSGDIRGAEPPAPFWHRPRWIWTGVAAAIVSMGAMTLWHLMGEPGLNKAERPPGVVSTNNTARPEGEKRAAKQPSADTEPVSEDGQTASHPDSGAVLHSIPGGKIELPAVDNGASRGLRVAPFQIEETPVTNHQFVEFLNSRMSTLTVARGVVREDDDIWLLLGEIFDGYEPIAFRNGRFRITNAGYASHPVLRVTPLGASAYAAFYGRRLPTRAEWYMAIGTGPAATERGDSPIPGPGTADMEQMHARMMGDAQPGGGSGAAGQSRPKPVSSLRVNRKGLRVMGPGFGEWALEEIGRTPAGSPLDEDVVLVPQNVPRKAWEAFEEVGFRCVKPIADPGKD